MLLVSVALQLLYLTLHKTAAQDRGFPYISSSISLEMYSTVKISLKSLKEKLLKKSYTTIGENQRSNTCQLIH